MNNKTYLLCAMLAATLVLGWPGGSSRTMAAPSQADGSTAAKHKAAVYAAALPLLSAPDKLPEAIQYLNRKIYAVTPYQGTLLALKLENLQKSALPQWEQTFSRSGEQRKLAGFYKAGLSMSELAARTEDHPLRTLLRSAGEHGYKLETAEGSFFPVIDYAAYRKYKTYVTHDISAYLTIMAAESDQPSSKDQGLVIAWTEVSSRALAQEQFIQKYPKSNRIAAVHNLYSMYLTNTFYGQTNTPLFHYDNLEMDLEAQKAYSSVLAKHDGNTPYLQKLEAFMKLLKDNGYKLDEDIKQFLQAEVPRAER
ncbi:hypothetical protein [Paenibacillus donghaensis]|uniref:Uncharacterized protein n=1 Tax=Paenibacillus donghaensis TaxID=414771 RepID=A0A2Z2KU77_9BACL|nr:hypothetical protein [Paenibacillus donghaensis]ASA25602.1 hypothetical protein B9T62_35645 [Paenibacillus donghaensis]